MYKRQDECRGEFLIPLGDGGPPQCRSGVAVAFPQGGGEGGSGEDLPDGGRQGCRVLVRHEQAGSVGEQFHGVREGGRDDRDPGRHRLHEHTRGDLVGGVVRQHYDVGGADQLAERGLVEVGRFVVHVATDAEGRAELVQAGPVRLAVQLDDLGMGPAGHGVDRCGFDLLQAGEGTHRPFDPFARAQESPGQQVWPGMQAGRLPGEVGGAVRDHGDFRAVDGIAEEKPVVRGPGEGDDRVGGGGDLFEQRLPPWSGAGRHGVQDDDARHGEPAQHGQDLFAVAAGIDAVLMLHDRDVEGVQDVGTGTPTRRRVSGPGVDHARRRREVVAGRGDSHNAARAIGRTQVARECGVEGCQAAPGGRVGAEKSKRDGHRRSFRSLVGG